ncbi:MAG: DNA polymerase III subunit delta [Anaerolineae bacterium]
MLYFLHGENQLQRSEALNAIIAESDPAADLRDMNTEILEGPISSGELRRACSTVPFLAQVRIVIARDVLSTSKGQAARDLADLLPTVPETTCLIFDEGQTLRKNHPVLKSAEQVGMEVRHFALPKERDLPGWIRQRTESYGGSIEYRAAGLLAQNIGVNLRLLDQEIQKLLLNAGERGEITVQDVRVMVPYIQSADVIFQMVDSIGQRDPRRAATYLHRLLEVGEHPLRIFGMVVRQFRLLIQIRWLMDRHYPQQQIVDRLKLHPYVVQKVHAQADHFTPIQLREAYRLLMATDLSVKQGEIPIETALDVLLAQLTSL